MQKLCRLQWSTSRRLKRAALILAALASACGLISPAAAGAQTGEVAQRLVDVGGRRLAIECAGRGSPTVVLDNGLPPEAPAEARETWATVLPAVAAFTRVCTYDRANLGRSDPAPRPRTSRQIVEDLHTLLRNAEPPGPYVLVGWSFGGLNVRLHASRYPAGVAGLVLVDSVHEAQISRVLAALPADVPAEARETLQQVASRPDNPEGVDLLDSFRQAEAAAPLPSVPLVVLTHGRRVLPATDFLDLEQLWAELQADLARRVPNGALIVAEASGHAIPLEQPDLVVGAIRRVVLSTRPALPAPVQVPRR
jgi:pimeloyl-ACP methyl ester carboxylesterase